MRMKLLALAIAGSLLIAGGIVYNFGTPQAPDPTSPIGSGPASPASGEVAAASNTADAGEAVASTAEGDPGAALSAQEAAAAEAAELADDPKPASTPVAPDPRSPLAIEIPGCVCHSDDPKLVEQHKGYRMNQCSPCHNGRTPTGAE